MDYRDHTTIDPMAVRFIVIITHMCNHLYTYLWCKSVSNYYSGSDIRLAGQRWPVSLYITNDVISRFPFNDREWVFFLY